MFSLRSAPLRRLSRCRYNASSASAAGSNALRLHAQASHNSIGAEYDELNNVLQAVADEQSARSEVVEKQDYQSISATTFKPIRPGRFIQPKHLEMHYRTTQVRYPKRHTMAPGAKEARENDPFYQLGVDPLEQVINTDLLREFVTDMGKIKPREQTRLTSRSQRRIAKAIKRAKMMGLMPGLSRPREMYGF